MKIKATKSNVQKIMGRKWGTWGEFKHKLVDVGILPSFYHDVPDEWILAWQEFSGRKGYPPIKGKE